MSLTRRDFAKTILGASAGFGPPPGIQGRQASPMADGEKKTSPSKVVIARADSLKRRGAILDANAAAHWLDKSMKALTGASSASEAWKSLFSPGEKVGVKLSCLPGAHLSSTPGLVSAVIGGLRSAGISDRFIFIWERTNRELQNAGFKLSQSGPMIQGTDSLPDGGYSNNIQIAGSVGTCFSLIMEQVDALISMPVLKDHDISGVSISMKNFYGAIHNPNKYHGGRCDPYIADLCSHPYIRNKLRLTICDASRVQVHNGPAFFPRYAWEYGGLLVGCDPVALDYTGWRIIETGRKDRNLPPLKNENREPSYIYTAARLKLGCADESMIQRIDVS